MPPKVQQICSTGLAVHGQSTVGPGTGGNSSQQNVEETTQAQPSIKQNPGWLSRASCLWEAFVEKQPSVFKSF